MRIRFYQTSNRSTEDVLAIMLQRVLQRHDKAIVQCETKQKASDLSGFLWKQKQFIPHGITGQDSPEGQPIWIDYQEEEGGEGGEGLAKNLFLCNGLLPDFPNLSQGVEDIILLFDKRNQDTIAKMREFWKTLPTLPTLPALPESSLQEISYWHDSSGKWQKAGEVKLQQENTE